MVPVVRICKPFETEPISVAPNSSTVRRFVPPELTTLKVPFSPPSLSNLTITSLLLDKYRSLFSLPGSVLIRPVCPPG